MVADGARIAANDSKFYIFGGQWDRIFVPQVPVVQPTMTIVLVIELDFSEALDRHRVEITLKTADGADAGRKAIAEFQTGHPPMLERGCSFTVPLALDQQNIQFAEYGRYEWIVELDGKVEGRLPITITPQPKPPLPIAPQQSNQDPT
jgi:hypothetical protein